jgi:hypothetical protein
LAKLERVASREALAQQVVECTALEIRRRCKPIGGSNPSLSATILLYPSGFTGDNWSRPLAIPKTVPKA